VVGVFLNPTLAGIPRLCLKIMKQMFGHSYFVRALTFDMIHHVNKIQFECSICQKVLCI
jgi:hypothetical protein